MYSTYLGRSSGFMDMLLLLILLCFVCVFGLGIRFVALSPSFSVVP